MNNKTIYEVHFKNLTDNGKNCIGIFKFDNEIIPAKRCEVKFKGWNPFPFYSAITTMSSIMKWMRNNDYEIIRIDTTVYVKG